MYDFRGTAKTKKPMKDRKIIIVLMGVAGSGKTTVGKLLSSELAWLFVDTDDLHPYENIKKMASGVPLTDEDRKPWLKEAKRAFIELNHRDENAVFAFPGLKQKHRRHVLDDNSSIKLVHLTGDFDLIHKRLLARKGHFFPAYLLSSQFDILQPPMEALRIDVSSSPSDIVNTIRNRLGI